MKTRTEAALAALLTTITEESADVGEEVATILEVDAALFRRRDAVSVKVALEAELTARALAVPAVKQIVEAEKERLRAEPVVAEPTPRTQTK